MRALAEALPPLNGVGAALGAWRLDPVALAFIVVAGAAYGTGVWRLRRRGGSWPVGRVAVFAVGGLGSVAVATMSFLGAYAHALFWVYTIQIMMLLMVCPVLLSLGAPLRLIARLAGDRWRRRLRRMRDARIMRVAGFPGVPPVLMAAIPFAVYFTGLYAATLRSAALYEFVHLPLLLAGFLLVSPLAEPRILPRALSYPVAIFVAFADVLLDAFPGIVIRFDTHVIAASYYLGLHRPWGPSLLGDQQIGGDALWTVGETIDIPFLAVLFIMWMRADREETARVDARLDAARPPVRDDLEPETTAPWWETDADAARVLGRRAAAYGWDTDPPR